MERVDAGFSADHLLVMELELPTDASYKTDPEMATFYKRALANLAAIPGVRSAGISCSIPLDEEDHLDHDDGQRFVVVVVDPDEPPRSMLQVFLV